MWSIVKSSNRLLHPDLNNFWEWPNTITTIIALRMRYDAYQEFSELLPEEHWDYPYLVQRHIEQLYPSMKNKTSAELPVNEIED